MVLFGWYGAIISFSREIVFRVLAGISFVLSFFLHETKSALIQDGLDDMVEKKLDFTKGKKWV